MNTDGSKILITQNKMANPITIWLLFLFLGWSYGSLGNIGLQILYYLTVGGLGIWTLIRLFTLSSAINSYNKQVCIKSGLNTDEMLLLGVV
jgi:hypothetical protein